MTAYLDIPHDFPEVLAQCLPAALPCAVSSHLIFGVHFPAWYNVPCIPYYVAILLQNFLYLPLETSLRLLDIYLHFQETCLAVTVHSISVIES
jgi:hypothetical protein